MFPFLNQTDTIELNVSEAGYEFVEGIRVTGEGRQLALDAKIQGEVRGVWTWSVSPSEGASIEPAGVDPITNSSYVPGSDQTFSFALLEFCEDGTYTVQLDFRDDECGDVISTTKTIVATGVKLEFKSGGIDGPVETSNGLVALQAVIDGNVLGFWDWSVTPSEGARLEPVLFSPDEPFFYEEESDTTISGAFLTTCEPGIYEVQLTYFDSLCGQILSASKTIISDGRNFAFEGGIYEPAPSFLPGVRTVAADIKGHAEGTASWSVSPSEGVRINTEFLGDDDFVYVPDEDVTRYATELTFCNPGTYQVSLVVQDEDCGKFIGTEHTIVVTEVANPCPSSEGEMLEEDGVVRLFSDDRPPVASPDEFDVAGAAPSFVRAEGRFHYYLKNLRTGRVTRGKAGTNGFVHPSGIRLRPNTRYEELVLDANTLRIARATWKTPESGNTIELPQFVLGSVVDEEDRDFDGLSDLAELIMGTNKDDPDTDNDGLLDGPEVLLGTNPKDNVPLGFGLVNELGLSGVAQDICAVGDYAVIASGEAGVHVVNIFNGRFPVLVATVDTPGDAQAIACGERFLAVADGAAGLAIIELRDPANESTLSRSVGLGSDAVCVAMGPDLAYVGLLSGEIVVVELSTGNVLNRVDFGDARVEDLCLLENVLYALQGPSLLAIDIGSGASLNQRHLVATGNANGAGGLRSRLFAGSDYLYLTSFRGYSVFDIEGAGKPVARGSSQTQQFGWKQVVSGGSGLAVAAVSANSTLDGEHNIAIYDDSDRDETNEFVEEIETSGIARAVALANGLAYVADGERGLSVASYVEADTAGVGPTLALRHNFSANEVEENGLLVVTAEASDDVQVRDVQLFLDGKSVGVDGSYPYRFTLRVPSLDTANAMALTAIARDTSGNASDEASLNLTIVENPTPVELLWFTPAGGSEVAFESGFSISMKLSQGISNESELGELLRLFNAGNDGVIGTEDDEAFELSVSYSPTQQTITAKPKTNLPGGQYQVRLAAGLKNSGGQATQEGTTWNFVVTGVKVDSFSPVGEASPYSVSVIQARADRALNLSTVTPQSLKLERLLEGGATEEVAGVIEKSLEDPRAFALKLPQPLVPGSYRATATQARDLQGGQIPETSWEFAVLSGRAVRGTPGFGQVVSSGVESASLVFSVPLRADTIAAKISLHRDDPDGEVVAVAGFDYSLLERRVTARFAEPLPGGSYVWTIAPGLLDFNGLAVEGFEDPVGFRVDFAETEVAGIVVDEQGEPVAGALARIVYYDIEGDPEGEPNRTESVLSGEDGSITFSIPAVGDFTITVSKETLEGGILRSSARTEASVPGGQVDLGAVEIKSAGFGGEVASGFGHSIWIDSERGLSGLGSNVFGQLGNGESGEFLQVFSAIAIGDPTAQWSQVAAGRDHSLGIQVDGTLWAWGGNGFGQLGDGTTDSSLTPKMVGDGWRDIAAGGWYTVGIKTDGSLWSWGYAPHGKETGVKRNPILEPEQIGAETDWKSVEAGNGYVLAIKTDGSLWAWGNNGDGQLGDGTTTDRSEPVRVGEDSDWALAAAGTWHSLAIKTDGSLWGWGSNRIGALGDGTKIDRLAPTRIGTDLDWVRVSCSVARSLARKADGSLWQWGQTSFSGLPGGSFSDVTDGPSKSSVVDGVMVSAGLFHSVYASSFDEVIRTGSIYMGEHLILRTNPGLGSGQPYESGYEEMVLDFVGDLDPAGAIPANIVWTNIRNGSGSSFREGTTLTLLSGSSKLVVKPNSAISPSSFYNITFGNGLIDVSGSLNRSSGLNLFSVNGPTFSDQYPASSNKAPFPDVTEVSASSKASIDAESIPENGLRLFNIGPDGLFETGDDFEVFGTLSFDAAENRIRLLLADSLPIGSYYAEASSAIRTSLGHSFFRRVFGTTIRNLWLFQVNEGPEVMSVDPQLGSTYFYNEDFGTSPPDSVAIVFSQTEMDETTLTEEFVKVRSDSEVGPPLDVESMTYDATTRTLRIRLASPMLLGTYFLDLSPEIQDAKGRKLKPLETNSFQVAIDEFGGS